MCGIVGVTGAADPVNVILDRLRSLEYRGYDSAGIAVIDEEAHSTVRVRAAERGRSIEKLAAANGWPRRTGAAVGHTRWATHGAPTEANAHPHFDCSGRLAVVHNGIIENHRALAARLVEQGHELSSSTDTEVVAHLLESRLLDGKTLVVAMLELLDELRGDFALAAVSADEPETIVAARRTSPLVIAVTANACYLASDLVALVGMDGGYYGIDDDEVVELQPGRFRVLDRNGALVVSRSLDAPTDAAAAAKGGFSDFMSKEIAEQPHAVADTLLGRVSLDGPIELEELDLSRDELAQVRRVQFVACGSSYHATLVGRQAIESLALVHADAEIASEFRYRSPILSSDTLVVAVSQSGETVDTLHALRAARQAGARTIAVSNVVGSLMAREADGVIYTRAGPEVGVASTKCHLAQLAILEVFALYLAQAAEKGDAGRLRQARAALLSVPELLKEVLGRGDEHTAVAARFAETRDVYFLGRHLGYPVALEGALKLKELAYVRAEAYPAGEMKHGPIALIEPGALVVVHATRTPLWEKVMANVEEMRARGATIIAVANDGDEETARLVDAVLSVPASDDLVAPMIDIVPLQRFAYEIARCRGNDVDRPRNLAKVVTVE